MTYLKGNLDSPKKRICIYPLFLSGYPCCYDCIYCNPSYTSGIFKKWSVADIQKMLEKWAASTSSEVCREVALYGCDFEALPKSFGISLMNLLTRMKQAGTVQKIRISIRPDTFIRHFLFAEYPFDTVELGVPSMDDHVLRLIKRGHTSHEVKQAITECKKQNINVGCQTMTALPGSDHKKDISTAHQLVSLKPDFVRIHPTLVIRNTHLEKLFKKGLYTPQPVQKAVDEVVDLVRIYRSNNIKIARLGFHIPEKMSWVFCAGPLHPSFGMLVESEIRFQEVIAFLKEHPHETQMTIPKEELSLYIGFRKKNIKRLRTMGYRLTFKTKQSV